MIDDRLGHSAIDRVDEHRARRRDWMISLVIGRINLRVAHRLDHVGDRRGERPERRDGALTGFAAAGIDQHGHDDELAVILARARTASAARA